MDEDLKKIKEELDGLKYEIRTQTSIIVLLVLLSITMTGLGLVCVWDILAKNWSTLP